MPVCLFVMFFCAFFDIIIDMKQHCIILQTQRLGNVEAKEGNHSSHHVMQQFQIKLNN